MKVKLLVKALRPGPLAGETTAAAGLGPCPRSLWRALRLATVIIAQLIASPAPPLLATLLNATLGNTPTKPNPGTHPVMATITRRLQGTRPDAYFTSEAKIT